MKIIYLTSSVFVLISFSLFTSSVYFSILLLLEFSFSDLLSPLLLEVYLLILYSLSSLLLTFVSSSVFFTLELVMSLFILSFRFIFELLLFSVVEIVDKVFLFILLLLLLAFTFVLLFCSGNFICLIKKSHSKRGVFSLISTEEIQVGSGLNPFILSHQSIQQFSSFFSAFIIEAFKIQFGISVDKEPKLLFSSI